MVNNESVIQIWKEYTKVNPNAPQDYRILAFGNTKEIADELSTLVIEGTKTATSSNFALYEIENEPLPYVGLHNIMFDGNEEAVAILETTSVVVVPFNEVTVEHAYLEGEGDRTLKFWRDVHEPIFRMEFDEINQEFDYNMPVVCEKFKVVYNK